VNLERDPKIEQTLALAFPPATPRYGAKLRVRRKLAGRIAGGGRGVSLAVALAVTMVACLAGVVFGLRRSGYIAAVAPREAVLSLRSANALLLDGARIVVERDDDRGTVLRLMSGTVLLDVQKNAERPFFVSGGKGRVRVVGTVFGVSLQSERMKVHVLEGTVELDQDNAIRRISAGETWPAGSKLFESAEALDKLRMQRRQPMVGVASPALSASAPTVPSIGLPSSAADTSPVPSSSAPPRVVEPATAKSRSVPARGEAPDGAYARARKLESAGEYVEARAAYEAIVSSAGPNAEDAQFALARLAARRSDHAAVLAAVARYRRHFHEGRYARDVDVLSLNAHQESDDRPRVLAEAQAFLSRYPTDARAWRFRLARAALSANAGDCTRARSDLAQVPTGEAKRAIERRCRGAP
jgi:hypothetical protein